VITLALVAIPIGLGWAKVAVGMARHHPVGFLTILTVVWLVGAIIILLQPPVATATGEKALADNRLRYARLARAPMESEVARAFAITGAAVLLGTPFAAFGQAVRPSSGSGCGRSGCGGGGGCGGCS
jgi:uncharacterized protein (TIGR04222 family)